MFKAKPGRIFAAILLAAVLSLSSCHIVPDPYGGKPRKQARVGSASFSPTQDLIVISFWSMKLNGIFLIDCSGKVVKWLSQRTDDWACIFPVFSPDGERIAFSGGDRKEYLNIYLMDKDGGNLKRLTFASAYDLSPVFSHDGQRIYFIRHLSVSTREGVTFYKGDIHCVDLTTGVERHLTNYKITALENISILPDSRYAIIRSERLGKEGNTCWKIDLDDPAQKWPIVPDFSRYAKTPWERFSKEPNLYIDIIHPVVSADGRYMAFSWANPEARPYPHDRQPQLYVMDMKTMKPRQLTFSKNSEAWAVAISAKGDKILFSNRGHNLDFGDSWLFERTNLRMINRDGTGLCNFSLDFTAVADKPPARK
jgi:dipeptidyl aminopeptidase/acylaminoacyl peptidase